MWSCSLFVEKLASYKYIGKTIHRCLSSLLYCEAVFRMIVEQVDVYSQSLVTYQKYLMMMKRAEDVYHKRRFEG